MCVNDNSRLMCSDKLRVKSYKASLIKCLRLQKVSEDEARKFKIKLETGVGVLCLSLI